MSSIRPARAASPRAFSPRTGRSCGSRSITATPISNRADRVAFASNPAFDASTMEVWATLLNGGAVVIIDQATLLDPQQFGRSLERHAITVLWLTAGF